MTALDFDSIISMIGGGWGEHDLACPVCGPFCKTPANRRREVLRVWRDDPDFVRYHCIRCGLTGHAHRQGARSNIDPGRLARLRAEAKARDADYEAKQRRKARWLFQHSRPIEGTPAETYLRSKRGIQCDLPATLRFLPPNKPDHHPAMIAPFGIAEESEPGKLRIAGNAVAGVHLTLLKSDGSGKAGTDRDKIMIGPSMGKPIVLAPANDPLGLVITEGIEDGLSVYEATGLGVWAAGSASRFPALADALPRYIDHITVCADNDNAGRDGASGFHRRAREIGFDEDAITIRLSKSEANELRREAA